MNTPNPTSDRLLRVAMLSCFAVAAFFAARALPTEISNVLPTVAAETSEAGRTVSPQQPQLDSQSAKQTDSDTHPESQLLTRNIEDIQLGQRVVGRNPLREETQPPSDINPATWRAVRLSMFKGGVKYDLAFLRPLSWLESNSAKVGHSIHLEMHEMGLNGPAKVVAIDPCPQIEPDDGTERNVVTGTMAHPGPNILYLDITGLHEPLGVTDTHPIWSETRHDFVVAGKLEVGEQFKTLTDEAATLTKITPHRGPPEMVFNLEVDGEHTFLVGQSGLLVHNSCGDSYEILDGVRRSKAAEIAEQRTVFAQIVDAEGASQGFKELPLDSLLSPKSNIDLSGAGLDRWSDTLRQTLLGSKPPPILVQPGNSGVPIDQVMVGF